MKNNKLILFFLIAGCLFFTTCKKVEKVMSVKTGIVTNILTNTADISGEILDLGDGVTQHGHCYAKTPNTNVNGVKKELGIPSGTGGFTSALEGLEPGTKYYIKAYCSRGKVTVYGSEINFITASAALADLTTVAITGITKTGAVSGGDISSQGGTPISARGVCWSAAVNPTTDASKTINGTGTGIFSSNISGLTAGTKYYVRAYATNAGGTAYGNEIYFTTTPDVPTPPIVLTTAVTLVTVSSSASGGNVTNDGGAPVTSRGVCWSTSINPDINGNKTIDGNGTGSYTSNISGLTGNTTYYIRAYAINSAGTAYGNELSFKTGAILPTVTTAAVTSITALTASSGGDVTSDGGSSVTERGICWSIAQNPTIASSHTNEGNGTGPFLSSITGLTPGTTYYIRAYATSSLGTAYGNELSFKASPVIPSVTTAAVISITTNSAGSGGTVTSDGGATVTARGVCWSTSANPTILNSKTTDASGTGSYSSSITGLSPGVTYYVKAYATNSAGTGYGSELNFKTIPVVPTLTTTAVTAITYNSGSSGGNVTYDGGAPVTARGVCWSTSQNPTIANTKTSDGSGTGVFTSNITGLSAVTTYYVRAYATNSAGTGYGIQQPFTTAATPFITVTSPTSTDHWMELEQKNITWSSNISENVVISLYKSGSLLSAIVASPGTANDGSYTWTLPGNLTYGYDYKIRISSVNNSSIFGESPLFKISESHGSTGLLADNDGNTYNTVKINMQWWMAANLKTSRLNDNSFISGGYSIATWLTLTTPAYIYYGNLLANFNIYGTLYNWYTVNTGKLCPIGWHVPGNTEWDELINYLGGESIAGGKLKEIGTTHWLTPNSGATNESGFTALPGGYLASSKGFGNLNQTGFFWSATQSTTTNANYLQLEYNLANFPRFTIGKYAGLSVRCIKD
jgi:uncharacterized protein (TIGR02145 family)